jgi:hypothetical protein
MHFICYISYMLLPILPSGALTLFGKIAANFIFCLNSFPNFLVKGKGQGKAILVRGHEGPQS